MKGGLDKKHGESEGHERGNLPSFSFRPPFLGLFFFPFPDSCRLFFKFEDIYHVFSSFHGRFGLQHVNREFRSFWTSSAFDRLIKILYIHIGSKTTCHFLLFAAFAFWLSDMTSSGFYDIFNKCCVVRVSGGISRIQLIEIWPQED